MNEEEPKAKPKQEPAHKKGVGFVENDRKKDYNIVYRNRPTKPMSVSDLFGIPKKEEPKQETKPEPKPEVVEAVEKVEPEKQEKSQTKEVVEEVKKEESVEKKENNMKQEGNNNYNSRPFNRDRRNNNNSLEIKITDHLTEMVEITILETKTDHLIEMEEIIKTLETKTDHLTEMVETIILETKIIIKTDHLIIERIVNTAHEDLLMNVE